MNQILLKKRNEITKKKKKGFTLVELIIVIAVIAVLAAIAIPKFGQVKKDANIRADQANAKIIATAVATAISNGDITGTNNDIADSVFSKYIDGGVVPTVKSVTSGAWDVAYDAADSGKGITVKVGTVYMYPPDRAADPTNPTT